MPPVQPQSPNPDFDFMLKDQPTARRGLPLPNLPRPVLFGVFGVIIIIVLIIVYSLFSGRDGGKTQPIIGALARAQETLRVTNLVQTKLQLNDPQTQALAATTAASLNSDEKQLTAYLTKNHVKLNAAQLAIATDSTTDASLQIAAQNNSLDQAYITYLHGALDKYETDLKTAYQSAGPKAKTILNNASVSTTALLNSPPLKS